jgi:hypothetical protein
MPACVASAKIFIVGKEDSGYAAFPSEVPKAERGIFDGV